MRGRRLSAPKGRDIRPAGDKVRQAVFNMLAAQYGLPDENTVTLDGFCGTGAYGLEALSRGAGAALFLDRDIQLVKTNIAACGAEDKSRIIKTDLTKLPQRPDQSPAAALAFLDPPYRQDLLPPSLKALAQSGWLAPGAVIVAECEKNHIPAAPDGFAVADERNYGSSRIYILEYGQETSSTPP